MEIATKYNIGDTVYFLNSETVINKHTCLLCDGLGAIEVKGKLYTCPECKGSGDLTKVKQDKLKVSKPYYVNYIEIRHFYSKDEIKYWATENKSEVKNNGFGGTWATDKNLIFTTYEEALKECSKRNKMNGYEE